MSNYDLIIRNGNIVTENGTKKGDIAIKDGKIADISTSVLENCNNVEEINAEGLHIFPGVVDVHVHFNEPGRVEWEGLATGSSSLAAGGATTFFDMPLNSDPPTINKEQFMTKMKIAQEKSVVDFGLLGGLVPDNLDDLSDLMECGAVGLKGFMPHSGIDEFSAIDGEALYDGLKKASELDAIVMLHAESQVITTKLANEAKSQGRTTAYDFEKTRPVCSEVEAVERALSMAEATNAKLHIVHASAAEVARRVNMAKARGVDATVETCTHYLSLNVDDLEQLGAIAKCCPPVRTQDVVDELWEAVANGEIDFVSSDHSPSSGDLKVLKEGQSIFDCWGGISSAQSTLNVMLEEGHFKRNIPLETIARLTSTNPAKRFGIYPKKGSIEVGSDADFAIVDLNKKFTLEKEDLFYRHKHSPFIGREFRGKVLCTILRGQKVFENGEILQDGSYGEMILNR